jgi:hypothetical protein
MDVRFAVPGMYAIVLRSLGKRFSDESLANAVSGTHNCAASSQDFCSGLPRVIHLTFFTLL